MSGQAGRAAVACGALAAAAGLGACGGDAAPRDAPVPPRTSVVSDGLRFTAVRFREIDPILGEDDDLYEGPAPGRGEELAAAFIEVCNVSETARRTPEVLLLQTADGELHEPIDPSPGQRYAYRPEELQPGECQPDDVTIARSGAGAIVLVFELAAENSRRSDGVRLRLPTSEDGRSSVLRFPSHASRRRDDPGPSAGA